MTTRILSDDIRVVLAGRSRVNPENGCREWLGSKTPNGYGQLRFKKCAVLAHRAAWEADRGPVPAGMLVLHRCDNRSCINLEHLFLGTAQDNSDDMRDKGRSQRVRGEASPVAKLTQKQIDEIRARAAAGESKTSIGLAFGVHPSHVGRIASGQRWAS